MVDLVFHFVSVECDFSDGDVLNIGHKIEELVGKTNNEHDCARSVKRLLAAATGALWLGHNKMCFAEFGNKIIPPTTTTWNHDSFVRRACLFPGTCFNIKNKCPAKNYFFYYCYFAI